MHLLVIEWYDKQFVISSKIVKININQDSRTVIAIKKKN